MTLDAIGNGVVVHGVQYMESSETLSVLAAGATSGWVPAFGILYRIFYLKNTSNKQANFQLQGSPDKTEVFNLGSTVNLADGSGTATRDLITSSDPHRWLRMKVTSNTTDATVGSAFVWFYGENKGR